MVLRKNENARHIRRAFVVHGLVAAFSLSLALRLCRKLLPGGRDHGAKHAATIRTVSRLVTIVVVAVIIGVAVAVTLLLVELAFPLAGEARSVATEDHAG